MARDREQSKLHRSMMIACITLVCGLMVSACESRKTNSVESFHDSRISVEKVRELVRGDLSALERYVPTEYTVTPKVTRAASGQGYFIRLKWEYAPPTGIDIKYWSMYWSVEAFSGTEATNLTKLQLPPQDNYLDSLEWLMPIAIKNGYFEFELSGVVSNRSSGQWIEGTVRLARIRVDLRELY